MNPEVKTERTLTVADIIREVKKDLPPEKEIRRMIAEYGKLTEKEKLLVDRYYFLLAHGVSEEEARTFYEALMKGKRVCPGLIDKDHQIRCPVARMRLERLGPKAQEIFLKVFWGLEEKNEILEEEV